jgi:catechol 2,3-dioxygenase-like lactoylglutathione lyase family enzyme
MSLPDLPPGNPGGFTSVAAPAKLRPIERIEPLIRADAMAFVHFRRADPERMDRFLRDFGLVPVESAGGVRYYRGVSAAPFLVAIEPGGDDAFVGLGVTAARAADLKVLADALGVAVEDAPTPGGGQRVRLVDPDGLEVTVVHGATALLPLVGPAELGPVNTPFHKKRVNATVRPPLAPSPIFKLGHVVLQRPDFDRAAAWYMRHLGIIPSDIQVLDDGTPALGFFRLDRGGEPADHHSIAILGGPGTGLLHVSFETFDIDSVGQGHQFLKAKGWTHFWGIGRHNLGSQFFDYWKDPAGDEWEHYADGDVLDAGQPTGYHGLARGTLWTWGDDLPDSMRPDFPLDELDAIHASGAFGGLPLEKARLLFAALDLPPRPWLR